jgi:hypothetical protein
MKRFRILVVALFGVFAFGVVATSSAMAEEETTRCAPKAEGLWELQTSVFACSVELTTANSPFELVVFLLAEWLVEGLGITTTLLVQATGELLLEDRKATLGIKAMVLCSGIVVGTIGANGAGEATEVSTLSGTAIPSSPLSGTGLLCNGQEGCTTGTEDDEVWPIHLPWKGSLELMEEASPTAYTGFAGLGFAVGGDAGWYVLCATALGTLEDECTGEEGAAETINAVGGVEGVDSEAFTLLAGVKLGNCSASSEKETGVLEGSGEIKIAGSSEVLSVSSTG